MCSVITSGLCEHVMTVAEMKENSGVSESILGREGQTDCMTEAISLGTAWAELIDDNRMSILARLHRGCV